MDDNPFDGLIINIDNIDNIDNMATPPPAPVRGQVPVPVANIQQVVGPLVNAIIQGNQNVITSQENLERSRRFIDRVPACDGEDVAGLREWVKELALIPLDHRLDVLLLTA